MISALKEAFSNWIAFLRMPNDATSDDLTIGNKLKLTSLMFLIELPVVIVFCILMGLIEHFKLIDIGNNKLIDSVNELSYIQIILLFVLIGPFIEEVIFRLPLRYKRNYLLRALVWILSLTGIIENERLSASIQRYWQKYFGYFFYTMAFVFGFIHLTNFEKAKELIFIIPILTITQCLGGLIMGYLRVKLGFLWGYLYHLSFNFIFLTLGFLSLQSNNSSVYAKLPYHFNDKNIIVAIIKSNPDPINHNGHADCIVTPGMIEYHAFKVDELISSLYSRNYKYIHTGHLSFSSMDIIDLHIVLKIPQTNTDSIRHLADYHLQKALGIKIEKQLVQKDAWELYVIDRIKLQKDSFRKDLVQISGNLKRVGIFLDMTYENEYIYAADTLHHSSIMMPVSNKFEDLPAYLEKEYGLGLRKVNKEIEFITIDLDETKETIVI